MHQRVHILRLALEQWIWIFHISKARFPKLLVVFFIGFMFLRTQIYAGAVHLGQSAKVGS